MHRSEDELRISLLFVRRRMNCDAAEAHLQRSGELASHPFIVDAFSTLLREVPALHGANTSRILHTLQSATATAWIASASLEIEYKWLLPGPSHGEVAGNRKA